MSLNSKIKLNIVILKGNKFDITFPRTIFNNIFRVTMRTRRTITFKKTFKNFVKLHNEEIEKIKKGNVKTLKCMGF